MSSDNTKNGSVVTDALIRNILETRFDDIPEETVDNTKRRILDMIGCIIGGAGSDGSRELAEVVHGWGGNNEASILGYGYKGPAHEAAMVNGIFGRSFDWGPLTLIIEGDGKPGTLYIDGKPIRRFANHIGETTVPAALALGECKGITGKELITAVIVADDLAARLHIANDRTPPGQAPSPDMAPAAPSKGPSTVFASTAAAGRLLGLTPKQLRNALGLTMLMNGSGGAGGIGGMMPRSAATGQDKKPKEEKVDSSQAANPGWLGVNDPYFKAQIARGGYEEGVGTKMSNGIEARNGVNAAQLAAAGWPGSREPLFDERTGFYPSLELCNRAERITDRLGELFIVEQVFKPWPGGRPTSAVTEASLIIANRYDINTDDIEEVILHLTKAAAAVHYSKPYLLGDYPAMNALWSFYYAVAGSLYRKSSDNYNFIEKNIRDPKLQELIKKVRLDDLDKDEGIELEVRMKDGQVYTEYVPRPLGEPYRPFTRDMLVEKFMKQAQFSGMVKPENAEKMIELLENLEEVSDINQVIALGISK
ncbi:MAG: MmgE/PrpD family protein [Dehalococcoidales bacterium]|nr:MmgE/PrpD family protein [Dehalococcoidales bacterium]